VPGPMAFGLKHQGPAQEGADNDQCAQYEHVLNSGIQHNGVDDVCRNQNFERDLHGFSDDLFEIRKADLRAAGSEKAGNKAQGGDEDGGGYDENRQDLQPEGDPLNNRKNYRMQGVAKHSLFIDENPAFVKNDCGRAECVLINRLARAGKRVHIIVI